MNRSLDLIEKRLLGLEKMIGEAENTAQRKEIQAAYEWWRSMREQLD